VLLEQLGAGGMGLVFAAFDEHLDRKVAIKLVRPQAPDRGSAAQERLLREAQALARLSHPNIVAVHEAGVLPDGDVFIAMEFIKGASLRQWQRASERSWREILSAYVAAATGLSAGPELLEQHEMGDAAGRCRRGCRRRGGERDARLHRGHRAWSLHRIVDRG